MTHLPIPPLASRFSAARVAIVLALIAACSVLVAPAPAGATPATASPAGAIGPAAPGRPAGGPAAGQPDLGPNVYVFDPSMPLSEIQQAVDAVAAQQIANQFGSQRYALLFKPGSYGTAEHPLNFAVGYYTDVAGLGASPDDVVINGSVYVRNQCDSGGCIALNNFWRSLSNLTINVANPDFGCYTGQFWAVSQAAPMRRGDVNRLPPLDGYCPGPALARGGVLYRPHLLRPPIQRPPAARSRP